MKKIAILCLLTLFAMGSVVSYAQAVDSTDNKLSIKVLPTKDIKKIPVEVSLKNSIDITCVQCFIAGPTSENTFLVAADDSTSVVYKPSERWHQNHTTMFAWNEREHKDMLMAMVVNTRSLNFSGNEGPIITVYFDGSALEDGDYSVRLAEGNAIWTDRKAVKSYDSPATQANFKIKKHKLVL